MLLVAGAMIGGGAPAAASAADIDEFKVKREAVFEFAQKPQVMRQGDRVEVRFETKGPCDATVAIEDCNGRIVHRDTLKGITFAYGVGIDRDDSIYILLSANRLLDGKPYFNPQAGTLMKFKPSAGRILTTQDKVSVPLPVADRPKRSPDLEGYGGGQLDDAWGDGAEWFYCGVGWHGRSRLGPAYAAAGIANYDGTYVYALDAAAGRLKWCNDTSGRIDPRVGNGVSLQGPLLLNGNLTFNGGSICGSVHYDLQTGLPGDAMGYGHLYCLGPCVMVVLAGQSACDADLLGAIQKDLRDWLRRNLDELTFSTLPDMRYIPWGDMQSGGDGGVTHEMAGTIDALAWALKSLQGARFSRWLAGKPLPEVQWLLNVAKTPKTEPEEVVAANAKSWLRCRALLPGLVTPEVKPSYLTELSDKESVSAACRVTFAYKGQPALTLVHLLDVDDGAKPGPSPETKVRIDGEMVELSLRGQTYVFAGRPAFTVSVKPNGTGQGE